MEFSFQFDYLLEEGFPVIVVVSILMFILGNLRDISLLKISPCLRSNESCTDEIDT